MKPIATIEQHRGEESLALDLHRDAITMERLGDGQHPAGEIHDAPMGRVALVRAEGLPVGQHEQQRTEDVEDPGVVLDQGSTDSDERATHDQGDDDPDHQHLLLELSRHREAGHHDEEDEEIVDREGLLGQVPGEVLPAEVPAGHQPDSHPEEQGEADIETRPAGGFTDARRVRPAHVNEELEHEETDRDRDRDDPDERRDRHGNSLVCR
jgi:hypothetical protein